MQNCYVNLTNHTLFVQYESEIEELRNDFAYMREGMVREMEDRMDELLIRMDVNPDSGFSERLRHYLIPES